MVGLKIMKMKPKLYRPKVDRVIAGVCSSIGYHLNIDPIFIRILFVILIFYPFPIFLSYLILWIFTPSGQ